MKEQPFRKTSRAVTARIADLPPVTVEPGGGMYTMAACEGGPPQKFYILPGDDPEGLYRVAAAYLAMAGYLERTGARP